MKMIGLLGGIGWEATAAYYRLMNDYIRRELGDGHTARILLHSVNAGALDETGDESELDDMLVEAGLSLKAGGADFMIMAANRMHRVAEHVSEASGLGLLPIADPVGAEMRQDGCARVALLGTRLAMESSFYSDRLASHFDISVITPTPDERGEIDRIIAEELNQGVLRTESRAFAGALIGRLHDRGAEAVILGCPEVAMIVPPDSDELPAYDATRLHARAAVWRSIGKHDG